MKTSELRIGNLVYSQKEMENGDPIPVLVIGIDTQHITYLSEKYELHSEVRPFQVLPKQIYPIPLSKIWLDKFGFEDYFLPLPGNGELEIRLHDGSFHIWSAEGQTESNNYSHPITGIHQLQNLYFALTAEELSINK
ncbi:hypothetical protein [Pedobacter gandavensis]|uniref:hypothetical protein n=1 Tax=Pedobacter gandavensis TaxID=2679963 RepID=UPI00292D82C6|nr:hypothetical protein [Pedobacter gandavensis]